MRICTYGLWHLGSVLSAHLAKTGFHVVGVDPDKTTVDKLNAGRAPLFEPGLDEVIQTQLANKTLRFTSSLTEAVADADVVWITFDTPVRQNDQANVAFLSARCQALLRVLKRDMPILISSQVPVGFCAAFESSGKNKWRGALCYTPENLRLGKALQVLENTDRIVAGIREPEHKAVFEPLLAKLCPRILWMGVESAEMTKHAINAFLATSVAFSNELAALCESTGADAREVSAGMLSEARIGPNAYLKPGAGFAGGTLGRDVEFLREISRRAKSFAPVIGAVKQSNDRHRGWVQRKILSELKPVKNKTFSIWGLAYKAGTDTLRRSWAIELIEWLVAKKANVKAYDETVKALPPSLKKRVQLLPSMEAAINGAHCLIIGNDNAAYQRFEPSGLSAMAHPVVIDPNRSLWGLFHGSPTATDYYAVGFTSKRKPHAG